MDDLILWGIILVSGLALVTLLLIWTIGWKKIRLALGWDKSVVPDEDGSLFHAKNKVVYEFPDKNRSVVPDAYQELPNEELALYENGKTEKGIKISGTECLIAIKDLKKYIRNPDVEPLKLVVATNNYLTTLKFELTAMGLALAAKKNENTQLMLSNDYLRLSLSKLENKKYRLENAGRKFIPTDKDNKSGSGGVVITQPREDE